MSNSINSIEGAGLTLPLIPITDDVPEGLFPISPQPTPPPFYVRKGDPKTVTATVSLTISEFYMVTESTLLTVTDTVYINKTVFNYITVTHTNDLTHTLNNTVPTTVFATTTLSTPTAALVQATLSPAVPTRLDGSKLKPVAIVFIVLGVLVGVLALMGLGWFGLRRYRAWKAKENQRMRGVELQRRWEMEQEDGRVGKREVDGVYA
ncbi:MAG: hypothetical protein Q9170_000806 [Blastenia crenularia]